MAAAVSVRMGRPYGDPGAMTVRPHADKAISQRATLLAALADGRSRITNLADCRDTNANLTALTRLGIPVVTDGAAVTIDGTGGFDVRGGALDAGNSATTARLLIAMLAGGRGDWVVDGNGLLRNRPMGWLVDPLRLLGADVRYLGQPNSVPVRVVGTQLRGGTVDVEVDSAQPVSALLFAGLAADDRLVIRRRTAARDHTERLLRWTGLDVTATPDRVTLTPGRPRAFDLAVPGDPSAAALLAALHLASPRAEAPLVIEEVCLNPTRMGFFAALRDLGARVAWRDDITNPSPEPTGSITIQGPLELDGGVVAGRELIQSAIDELPLLAALACRGRRPLVIGDAAELRDKDTDRIATTVRLLNDFGVAATATEDGLVIRPSRPVAPAVVSVPADHRLVFAACVLGLLAGGELVITGFDAAATSYPALADDLAGYVPVVPL